MMRPRGARPVVALALAAALVLGSCGGDDEHARSTTTTTTTTEMTTTTETTTTSSTEPPPATGATCSASALDGGVGDQPALPAPVAQTRRQIAEAAAACDYEALQALAQEGDAPFTHSFGDSGEAATYWQRRERERGEQPGPLRFLVEILQRPHGVVEHGGVARYVWPSAFAHDTWDAVPEADRQALEPLYGPDDFESFDRFGGYIGYRVVILEDGTWTAFVAGD